MKRLFLYVTVLLLFSAGAAFAGDGDGYATRPCVSESGDAMTQGQRPDSERQKSGVPTPSAPSSEGAGSSYRQEGPSNPVKSRWQIDMGGFVGVDIERRQ